MTVPDTLPSFIRQRSRLRSTVPLLVLLPLISTQALPAQQPETIPKAVPAPTSSATPASEKAPASGSIKGRMVIAGGRVPKNALVAIRGFNETSGQSRMVRVDSSGRFTFDDLSPGVYSVIGTAPGFIDEAFWARDVLEVPRHLPGAQVTIRMVKGGVITGTIRNQKGDPVVGVNVRALQIGHQRNLLTRFSGEPRLVETDDRGVYRIYGLPAGEYLVTAGGRGPLAPFMATGFDTHSPTYYPSSTRDTAVPVEVRTGEEATGIDIRYRNAQGYSISGVVKHVVDKNTNVNISTVTLFDLKTNTILAVASSNLDSADRSFKFEGVADGDYELLATFFSRAEDNRYSGTKKLTVSGADLTGVEISLKALSSVEGSIKLEPAELKCDKRGSQVIETLLYAVSESKTQTPNMLMRYGLDGTIVGDNTFKIRNLEPGRFRFVTHLPTEAWYLSDIQVPAPQPPKATVQPSASRYMPWQGTVLIKSGESIRNVVITIGQDAAGLNGTIRLPKGVSAVPEGLEVHLVPIDPVQANNVLRYYETKVESNGQFSIPHIAPGRYFSVTRIRPPEQTRSAQSPQAWDPMKRVELRRSAESTKNEVELKTCQKLNDYVLNVGGPMN